MTSRTIHVARERFHLAWDNALEPIATIASGDVVDFDLLDASCGQITSAATVETIRSLDFSRVDQVNGPIAIDGARPGDTLEIEFLAIATADWGWTTIIPGFGLLADEFTEPAVKIWKLDGGANGFAEFAPGIRVPLAPFCGRDRRRTGCTRSAFNDSAVPSRRQHGHKACDGGHAALHVAP